MREAAERIGYPVIVKPIAGAGSADTHRCDSRAELEQRPRAWCGTSRRSRSRSSWRPRSSPSTRSAPEAGSRSRTSAWYRPRPLVAAAARVGEPAVGRAPEPRPARARRGTPRWAGRCSTRSASSPASPTWSGTASRDGEVVFGEIGGRPPGARLVDMMNYCTDDDTYLGWAEAALLRRDAAQQFERKWNVAITFKRAQGQGRIRRIAGLEPSCKREFGGFWVEDSTSPRSAPRAATGRRPWWATATSSSATPSSRPSSAWPNAAPTKSSSSPPEPLPPDGIY